MAKKPVKETIHAKGLNISIYTNDFENEYVSLTDIAKYRSSCPSITIYNWQRSRYIVVFLGLWASLHNQNLNVLLSMRLKRMPVPTLTCSPSRSGTKNLEESVS